MVPYPWKGKEPLASVASACATNHRRDRRNQGSSDDPHSGQCGHCVPDPPGIARKAPGEVTTVQPVACLLDQMPPEDRTAMMVDEGAGLVDDPLAQLPQLAAQLGILSRPVAGLETAHRLEVRLAHQQVHRGEVVHVTGLARPEPVGVPAGTHRTGEDPTRGALAMVV